MKKKVDNEVFRFRVTIDLDLDVNVFTRPFPEEDGDEYVNQEKFVEEKYFSKEKIEELKQKFIKEINESDNPFYIFLYDRDANYDVTEDMIFDM